MKILSVISRAGSFRVAVKGLYKEKEVLVKKVKSRSSYLKDIFAKEMLLMSKIRHENIVSLIALSEDPDLIMMEYWEFPFIWFQRIEKFNSLGQLSQYLSTEDLFTYFQAILNFMARDLGKGLGYLHDNNVFHRDIKSGNILVMNTHQHPCLKKHLWFAKLLILVKVGPKWLKLNHYFQQQNKAWWKTNTHFYGTRNIGRCIEIN